MDAELPGRLRETDLLADYSMEMTAKDVAHIVEASPAIAPGAQVSVTFLPNEHQDARVAAAATVRRLGFTPMPHISARRLKSIDDLRDYLGALRREVAPDRVFVVAGDADHPEGPYPDAMSVIRSGLLEAHGISHVGLAGYPGGHPHIPDETLQQALLKKRAALASRGLSSSIITQFGFDAEPVLDWIAALREAGVDDTIRVGVPGPTSIARLLKFAARCGVGASAKVMSKYGISMTRLLGHAGPDLLVKEFADQLDADRHGRVRLHFYPLRRSRQDGRMDPQPDGCFRRLSGLSPIPARERFQLEETP